MKRKRGAGAIQAGHLDYSEYSVHSPKLQLGNEVLERAKEEVVKTEAVALILKRLKWFQIAFLSTALCLLLILVFAPFNGTSFANTIIAQIRGVDEAIEDLALLDDEIIHYGIEYDGVRLIENGPAKTQDGDVLEYRYEAVYEYKGSTLKLQVDYLDPHTAYDMATDDPLSATGSHKSRSGIEFDYVVETKGALAQQQVHIHGRDARLILILEELPTTEEEWTQILDAVTPLG